MFGLKELHIAQGLNHDDLKTKIQQLTVKAFAYMLTMVHQFSLPPMLPNHSIVDQIHPQPAQGQCHGMTSHSLLCPPLAAPNPIHLHSAPTPKHTCTTYATMLCPLSD